MSVTIFGLGAYFYLDEHEYDVSSLGWLPLVSKLFYLKPSNYSMYYLFSYFDTNSYSTVHNIHF